MIQKLVHRNRLPTSPFLVLAAHLRLSLNFVRNSFCNEVDVKNKPRTDSEDKKTLTLSPYSMPTLHNNYQHNLCTNHFRGIRIEFHSNYDFLPEEHLLSELLPGR